MSYLQRTHLLRPHSFPLTLEGSGVVDSLTDARTTAVKSTQSKDCLSNMTGISKYSRGPIIF